MTNRCLLIGLLSVVFVAAVATAQVVDLQILEQRGHAGGIDIGVAISRYDYLKTVRINIYSTADGTIEVSTDGQGKVNRISASKVGMFTQRLVTIGQSTLMDVVERYGQPKGVYLDTADRIAAEYDGIIFIAAKAPQAAKTQHDLNIWTVLQVDLHATPTLGAIVYVYAKAGEFSPYKPQIYADNIPIARLQSGRFFKANVPPADKTQLCAESQMRAPFRPCWGVHLESGKTYYLQIARSFLSYKLIETNEVEAIVDLIGLPPIDRDMVTAHDLVILP